MSSHYSNHSYSNVKPFSSKFRYHNSYGLVVFVLIMLIMSWETGRMDTAIASGQIPQEAIRLRILANSDSPADQAVKRVVRDEIVKAMGTWASGPQTIDEARQTILAHMPEIKRITAEVLANRGFTYGSDAELSVVPFPTKMYGSEMYPAGDYEAVRITLGAGNGQNWWCVLFPPLCFVDGASGEAAAGASTLAAAQAQDTTNKQAQSDVQPEQQEQAEEPSAPKAKFFLWEMIQNLFNWIKSLFA
ncbi:stage II sporulation protein R [Paenibacillus harenae]|uniref:stage II sporulation protein R n=1 Tax=Paenibacillus harenae TaxID=306543 RepID=UPI0027D8267B|nr:stage II sporulation protein R [Paenibacillus harenae]